MAAGGRNLGEKIQEHPGYLLFTVVAGSASIVGAAYAVPFFDIDLFESEDSGPIYMEGIEVVDRHPLWGHEEFDDDEIVVSISGRTDSLETDSDAEIVAFWRLASGYETNWHAGRRTDGGNYRLSTLDAQTAQQGPWDFMVGGIEADKDYDGSVSIVLCAINSEVVEEIREKWVEDNNGWGFEEIPSKGRLAGTPPRSFNVTPVR